MVRLGTPLDEANTVLHESTERFRDVLKTTTALHVYHNYLTISTKAADSTIDKCYDRKVTETFAGSTQSTVLC